jgi:hypothetical protein
MFAQAFTAEKLSARNKLFLNSRAHLLRKHPRECKFFKLRIIENHCDTRRSNVDDASCAARVLVRITDARADEREADGSSDVSASAH